MRASLALLVSIALAAQSPGIRVETQLVVVPAFVTDAKGRAIPDLGEGHFTVLDNGVPQQFNMETFGTGVAPIALVTAVQTSGISAAAVAKVRQIGSMIQPLITGERGCAGLVTFAGSVDWQQECTSNPDKISAAFSRIQTGDAKGGRMLDAATQAIEKLSARQGMRRVLLLISESRDRGSETDMEPVLVAASRAGVMIYAATYSAFRSGWLAKASEVALPRRTPEPHIAATDKNDRPGTQGSQGAIHPRESEKADLLAGLNELIRLGKTKTTEALAEATGAAEYPFTKLSGLENAIQELGEEVHSQYVLSFTPQNPAPGYHKLEVRVAGRQLVVRARPGYWVNPSATP